MVSPGSIGHVDGDLGELGALSLTPGDRVGRAVDEVPRQAGIAAPMVVLHEVPERLIARVGDVLLLLHLAPGREYSLDVIGGAAEGAPLLAEDYTRPRLASGQGGGETGKPASHYGDVCPSGIHACPLP